MARGGRYYCSKCGHTFTSYQQEDELGDPAFGCENCGSRRVRAVTSIWEVLGCVLVPLVLVAALGLVAYWAYQVLRG